jgi:hypothetical protein
MKTGQYSETSAHKIQTPGNHPKERIQHSQDESFKSSIMLFCTFIVLCQPLLYISYKQVLQFVPGLPFFVIFAVGPSTHFLIT